MRTSPEETYSAFHTKEPLKAVAARLGVSPNTLRRWWKDHFGEEAFEARKLIGNFDQKAARQAFHSNEGFKAVAKRLGMSIGSLRKFWVGEFGKEAFDERSRVQHVKAGKKAGYGGRGKPKKARKLYKEACEECGAAVTLNGWQKGRRSQALCQPCEEGHRGVDRHCPVCGVGCVGKDGLAYHMARPYKGDVEAHAAYLQEEKEARWRGLEEDCDFVVCRVCGFRGEALNMHIGTHGMTAEAYQFEFPGALIVSGSSRRKQSAGLRRSHTGRLDLTPEDLLRCADEEGKVIVEVACETFKCVGSTVLGYCRKYGIPTRNRLAWQRVVLDRAKRYLGSDYVWEWGDSRITNPDTGRVLNFDGYFPEHKLVIEAHGEQHFRYSEKWHGTVENFEQGRKRDALKRLRAEELGFKVKVIRPNDPIYSDEFWEALLKGDSSLWENASEQDKADRVEELFLRLRKQGWPDIQPTPGRAKAELTQLRGLDVHLDDHYHVRPYSVRGAATCSTFFPCRYRSRYKGAKSVYEAWGDGGALRKAIRLQLDSGHPTTAPRVLRALVMHHRTPSVFRPAVAKYVCQAFSREGLVWDPCAGFGGRLMGAMAADVAKYIGTDANQEIVAGNRSLAEHLSESGRCSIHHERAEEFDPGPGLNLVFTSPPYLDLEQYEGPVYVTPKAWEGFMWPVIERAFERLVPGGHLVLNLPYKPIHGVRLDLMAKKKAHSLGFTEKPTMWLPIRSFKGPSKSEPLLVWQKPV